MPVRKLKEFLDSHKVKYTTIQHSTAYTAQEVAASAHIPGKNLAKVVMIKVNGAMAMAVLPAENYVGIYQLKESIDADSVLIADEREFKELFPECEVGAMPPFGNLYGFNVYVSEKLKDDDKIAFNAGTHRELIMLSYKDFENLVKPKIIKM